MTLRLGCSTGALFPGTATEEAIEVLARLGVADVEIMLQTHGECEAAYFRELTRRVRDAGSTVHSVHALVQLHPVFDVYARRAEEGWRRFEQVLEGAATLGAGVVVWHGLCRSEEDLTLRSPEVQAAIDRLAGFCARRGILLGLENVSWCAMSQVRDVLEMSSLAADLEHGASLAFTFDPFQAREAGANPFMVLNAMQNRLANVHLRDFDENEPGRRALMPGEGSLPWPALIRAIGTGGYGGPLVLEGALAPEPEAALLEVRRLLDPIIEAVSKDGPVCQAPLPPGVLAGIHLFNAGKFYECHEEIEHEWHAERGEVRLLYQGILQVGVGFHHARNGNERGALLLLGDGIDKVSRFLPVCRGVDTARFVTESQVCLDRIRERGLDGLDWSTVPHVHLRTDT